MAVPAKRRRARPRSYGPTKAGALCIAACAAIAVLGRFAKVSLYCQGARIALVGQRALAAGPDWRGAAEASAQLLARAAGKGFGSAPEPAPLEVEDLKKLSPAAAIERLLVEESTQTVDDKSANRIRQAFAERLEEASASEVVAAITELLAWRGIATGQGDAQAARNFPAFFACFTAVRSHVKKNADFWDMRALGEGAEGLVRLGMKIWGSDNKVNEALAKALAQELYKSKGGTLPAEFQTADFLGTLGLRELMETIAYAAVDLPQTKYPVNALASLAWALAEAKVENAGLQMKVARGIIADVDKLTPPDVGKLFIAMEDKRWFKDQNTIAYLTQALLSQVREMKKNDPGLVKILATS